jgi:hypothetical protein
MINTANLVEQRSADLARYRAAKLRCMIAAMNSKSVAMRASWLSAAESYDALERSLTVSPPAGGGTGQK